jgi:hypothetical protein
MKRTITCRASTNAGNIKEGVNSSESIQTCSYRVSHSDLVTDIRDSETRLSNVCSQSFAFLCIVADHKHRIFGGPQASCSGRNSR